MRYYTGIDIIEIERVKSVITRWGERFLRRIYTDPELRLSGRKPQSLAVSFACKEAVMKLLGTGRRGVSWREIETLAQPSGQPVVNLYGRARHRADEMMLKEIAVSLSHSKEYAVASVVRAAEEDRR